MKSKKYYISVRDVSIYSLLSSVLFFSFLSCTQQTSVKKPNIIIFLIDDAGYADFGFMGCKDLQTPNIDRLASQGIVFSDAHVSATVCGPSRAGILTGRYQQRFGFECNPPGDTCGLDLNEITIASMLKEEGYSTAAFGKWHLGALDGYRPNERGFDYFWGFLSGSRHYFYNEIQDVEGNPHAIYENNKQVSFDGYLTDRLADKTVDFIEKNRNKPFFIYWAPNAVHTPMEATTEDLNRFKGQPRQTLAAMTWALDRAIGNILNKLENEGLSENTLVFFLSDNGGAHNNQSSNLPLKGFKGNKYEGGHRVSFVVSWLSELEDGWKFDGLSSSLDIGATILDAANMNKRNNLDGVSLLPFLKKERKGDPHSELFWRKDKMSAVRVGNYVMIKAENVSVMYNLSEDLAEINDISQKQPDEQESLQQKLNQWESEMILPHWTEGATWDTINWMIYEDLFHNQPVRVKNFVQLELFRKGENTRD